MQSPLQRLYKTKLVLLAVIAVAVGSALLFAAHWVATQPHLYLLNDLPIADVGSALLTVGLVLIAFEYADRRDGQTRAMEQLDAVIDKKATAIRDAVVDGFAFAPDSLTSVASPAVLDRIVENCLAIQLGDAAFAADVHADLKAQVLRSPERWHDLRISAALAPWTGSTAGQSPAMYVATFRYDYHVTNPSRVLRFACVSDLAEYRELQADPDFTEVWYFQSKAGLDATSRETFELVEVIVAGRPQKLRRTTRAGAQYYSVSLDPDVDRSADLAVSFMYRALVQQHGHVLHVDLIKPTHGVSIALNYGGAGIRYVNVVDYIASAARPAISQTAATDPSPSVSLTFDGWALPKAGVAFVWVLEDEMNRATQLPRAD